jgi:hypothetical protein
VSYRNPKALSHARGQECQLQIPGVCNGNHETVVACHSNFHEHGKGKSSKAHDYAIAYGCSACHAWLDAGPAERHEKRDAFYWGWCRTLDILFRAGILK